MTTIVCGCVWGPVITEPIFFVVDEDRSAAETLVSDLERHFQADFRVMGETRG